MAAPLPARGSTALVTGASSGIGAEIARSLASRGHGVVLAARRRERLEALADELEAAHGVAAHALECDVADKASRDRMLARVEELGLRVEVLVNNAGYGSAGRFQELDAEREAGMVRLNCEAVVALCGRLTAPMVERGRGGILNVASVAGFQPLPRQATYAATKAFVLSFTDALHAELAGTGVSATSLCPGPVRTEFVVTAGLGSEAESSPGFFWTDAAKVAEQGVKAMERGKRVVVPGRLNAASALGGQHAPRSALLRLANRFYPAGR